MIWKRETAGYIFQTTRLGDGIFVGPIGPGGLWLGVRPPPPYIVRYAHFDGGFTFFCALPRFEPFGALSPSIFPLIAVYFWFGRWGRWIRAPPDGRGGGNPGRGGLKATRREAPAPRLGPARGRYGTGHRNQGFLDATFVDSCELIYIQKV